MTINTTREPLDGGAFLQSLETLVEDNGKRIEALANAMTSGEAAPATLQAAEEHIASLLADFDFYQAMRVRAGLDPVTFSPNQPSAN